MGVRWRECVHVGQRAVQAGEDGTPVSSFFLKLSPALIASLYSLQVYTCLKTFTQPDEGRQAHTHTVQHALSL